MLTLAQRRVLTAIEAGHNLIQIWIKFTAHDTRDNRTRFDAH
jgi:hypothetical protein